MGVQLIDRTPEIKSKLKDALKRAAVAVGTEAVGKTNEQMQSGYGKPIRQTGTLMRDVNYDIEMSETHARITIGNNVHYAPFVHFGTYKMAARPYLRDAIEKNQERFKEVAEAYFREAFE